VSGSEAQIAVLQEQMESKDWREIWVEVARQEEVNCEIHIHVS